MSIPKFVAEYLESAGIEYQLVELPSKMNISQAARFLDGEVDKLVRVVGLGQNSATRLAVVPYNTLLDIKSIANQTESDISVLETEQTQALFKNCEAPSCPPIAKACKVRLIIDSSVLDLPTVLMESGDPQFLIKLDKVASNLLFQELESLSFTATADQYFAGRSQDATQGDVDLSFTSIRLKQRIDETFDLPAMPDIAQDIMKLRVDPSADATKLAQIVCRDPSLAAQVISWASSPYYGYQGKVDSVETAIARVLGFELVMNLSLGISIGKCLKVPMEGPLGVKEFWKQAIYCASLAEKLCRSMPIKQRPERGLIYLSGLLHNFGHLLLGHIFPPQFDLVNNTILANPNIAIEDIEFYVLGVTHEDIGAWLMQNWHMPDELIVAVHRHHQEEFWSKHAVYSNIVLIANRLLKRLNIGDSLDTELPRSTLELLSITEELSISALKDIELESETLDIMANQLVA